MCCSVGFQCGEVYKVKDSSGSEQQKCLLLKYKRTLIKVFGSKFWVSLGIYLVNTAGNIKKKML